MTEEERELQSKGEIVALKFMAFFTLCAEKSIVFTMNERSAGQQSWGQIDGGREGMGSGGVDFITGGRGTRGQG